MIKVILLIIFLISISMAGLCNDEIKIIELNADNYEAEVLKSDVPVVIDFWASWCKYCKLMDPIIERLAIFHKDKVKFVKVDVDKSPKFLNNFRPLRGLPVLIFYKNGVEVDRIIGFAPFITINNKILLILKEEKKEKKDKDNCKGGVCEPPEDYKDDGD